MSITWWITAIGLVLAVPIVLHYGSRFVARRVGRDMPPRRWIAYEGIYFCLALGIGIPPIYLFPGYDSLFYTAFMFAGIIIGSLVAQALYGRRAA